VPWFFLIIGALALAVLGARAFVDADPRKAAAIVARIGGGLIVMVGFFVMLRGGVIFGVPMVLFGLGTLGRGFRWARFQASGQGDAYGRARPASSRMTVEEALEVLGLEASADVDEVRAAHKALMVKLHPDHGGSVWLAAKLNAARDCLLDGD